MSEPDLTWPCAIAAGVSFDSLGKDFVYFIKHTSVNNGSGVWGVELFSKQKNKSITFGFCYFVLCFAFLLDSLADVD